MVLYGGVAEEDTPRIPEPLDETVLVSTFFESNNASNIFTWRSHIGILLFVCNGPIKAFRQRQNNVESSTFVSELVELRIARDLIVEIRIKLESIGVPLKVPMDVYCDNQGVLNNTRIPESTLKKKHNSINYHVVRKAAAAGILSVRKEDTATNLDEPLTKLMPYS